MTALVIRGGHLIDPAAGVDALKDILLKDGRVAEIAGPGKLKHIDGAEVAECNGLDRCAGTGRHPCAPARAGPGLQRDHRYWNGCSRCRRIHFSRRNAQHHAGERFPGDNTLDAVG